MKIKRIGSEAHVKSTKSSSSTKKERSRLLNFLLNPYFIQYVSKLSPTLTITLDATNTLDFELNKIFFEPIFEQKTHVTHAILKAYCLYKKPKQQYKKRNS